MANAARLKKMTAEEYLRFEESQVDKKHEFVDGRVFAMTGGTAAHNLISVNIVTNLKAQLKNSGCRAYVADMKVRVAATNSFYYPDVMVDCAAVDKSSVFTETPLVMFEVLSRSTASTDRREKLVAYQQIPSLEAYVIVHQLRKKVEVYRRELADDWTIQELYAGDDLELSCRNAGTIRISVDSVYEDMNIDSSPDLQVKENAEFYAY